MKVITSIPEWKALRPKLSASLGLIPTMGFLHEGHLSLVRRARAENEVAVAWIFVNPKQFGQGEDFTTYPRDMDRDLLLLERERVDYVLAPTVEGVYVPGFQTYVNVDELSKPLEGVSRPGHFRGVATVVAKMFCLTQPRRAYFGQKDAQQCAVVTRMTRDLGMLMDVVVCPTVREQDGLAMSSRNVYLTPVEREAATVVYRALQSAAQAFRAGERRAQQLRPLLLATIASEPLGKVDYAAVTDPDTFAEIEHLGARGLALLAVKFGKTRLIDNIELVS
jgi:pantoate--beta-alanine ligase